MNRFLLLMCIVLSTFSASAQQVAQAEVDKAMNFYQQQDMKQAYYWFEQAAIKGNIVAMTMIGGAYLDGAPGIEVNPQKAAYWCEKAANNGDAIGQFFYGYCFARGEGRPRDMTKAIEWWKKAASQNHVDAQWNLCQCFYNGDGVNQDMNQAAIWAKKAADNGHAIAQQVLGYMYEQGSGVSQNYSLAIQWYKRSVDQGYSWAYNNLALMYAYGKGVSVNFTKAHELIDKAISIEPDEPNFLDSKGEICIKEGNMQKAKELWTILKTKYPEVVRNSINNPDNVFCSTMLKLEK